jgi:hypothetical protein
VTTLRDLLAITSLAASCAPAVVASGDPLALLPAVDDLEAAGEPERARGQDLYRVINGGAPLYLDHGFECLVARSYERVDGVRFTVEIYQMKDAAGARAVYTKKGGDISAEPELGDASTFEGYYGLYVHGRYHFAVTASRTQGDLRSSIDRLARAVIARIDRQPSPPP